MNKNSLILFFIVFIITVSCNNKEEKLMDKTSKISVKMNKQEVDSLLGIEPFKVLRDTNYTQKKSYIKAYYDLKHPFGYYYTVFYTEKDSLVISSNW